MSYVIETGIPIPHSPCANNGGPRGCRSPWSQTLDALAPGESTLTGEYADVKLAQQFRYYRPERKFVTRKIPGQGWRVWRVA